MEAFTKDQSEEAVFLAEKADFELETAKVEKERVKGLKLLSKNFIARYWWQILIILIIIAVVTPLIVKKGQKKRRVQKLKRLKEEL